LPLETVLWSNPGDGSGVTSIVPAVPSPTGVADVFAFQNDGTVAAITSDGTMAWSADVSSADAMLPDFQGGLVLHSSNGNGSITRLDGLTGQPDSVYTPSSGSIAYSDTVVHTDGTIFTIQSSPPDANGYTTQSMVGIDPSSGAQKFSVPLEGGPVSNLIIAGDGYVYFADEYDDTDGEGHLITEHFALLRVNSDGAFDKIPITDWSPPANTQWEAIFTANLITNADTGVLLSWELLTTYPPEGPNPNVPPPVFNLSLTTGTSVSTIAEASVGGQLAQIVPVLQSQDGSFVGTVQYGDPNNPQSEMIAFDATGNTRWTVPNEQPAMAVADGSVIGQSGVIYDTSGNAFNNVGWLPTYEDAR